MQLATQSENKLWHWRNKHALITHKHVDSRSGAVKSQLIFSLAMSSSSSSSHPLLFYCHNTTSWSCIFVLAAQTRYQSSRELISAWKKKESTASWHASCCCSWSRSKARTAPITSPLSHQVGLFTCWLKLLQHPPHTHTYAQGHRYTHSNVQKPLSGAFVPNGSDSCRIPRCQGGRRSTSCATIKWAGSDPSNVTGKLTRQKITETGWMRATAVSASQTLPC